MCERKCILARFRPYAEDNEEAILAELDDFRHLYAHNFAGRLDAAYFINKKAGARFRYAAATDLWRSIQRPAVATRYFAPQALRNSGPKQARALLKRGRLLGRGDRSEAVDRRQRLVCQHVR